MPARSPGMVASPIGADLVAAGERGYAELRASADALYWLEARPEEGGRSTLLREADGAVAELTPAPFSPRSRVHEYGGGAYCLAPDCVYFVDASDQNVYAVALTTLGNAAQAKPRLVVGGDASTRFADIAWDGAALLAVRERHGDGEPVNDLVRIDPASAEVAALHEGHDFYAAPRPSTDGRVAFVVWDHPNMPWDGTQLVVADYEKGRLANATVVAGGAAESIVQPTWCGSRLLFASDRTGYWNLHAYDESGVYCLLEEPAEYAGPAWQFGAAYFAAVSPRHVVARRVAEGRQSLVMVDLELGLASPVDDEHSSYSDIVRSPSGVAFIAGSPSRSRRIVEMGLDGGASRTVASPGPLPVAEDVISPPEAITFAADGGEAHAFFYPPREAARANPRQPPPLLVTTHGGPTSAANGDLSWRIQFYTSRGWAVADVNYSGSTGFGRAYRERLNGGWGVVDVADCVACVRHLVATGRADPARVAIRGGSAGGYTTLAALTFADVFKAGACHYGIGDLRALDDDTHKFESRYVGTLTGGGEAVDERSPINHVNRLNCPVIFFQGAEDRVVPPQQAEAMRDALRAKGIEVEYLLFEGEGHGFRRAENIRTAIDAEYAFFARVFDLPRHAP